MPRTNHRPDSVAAMSEPVTLESDGDIAVIRIDDGKANALSHDVLDRLNTAVDDADDAKALVLFGREGKFSAGFDLAVMKAGIEAAHALTRRGAEFCMRLYGHKAPVLAGSDGHALAAGALVLLSCDIRIASDSPGKIGLPETTIGMPLPVFATELARDRLSRRHYTRATLLGSTYSPAEAVDVGYVDEIVPLAELESTVIDRATAYADAISPTGFATTRVNARQATIDHVLAGLDADVGEFTVDG